MPCIILMNYTGCIIRTFVVIMVFEICFNFRKFNPSVTGITIQIPLSVAGLAAVVTMIVGVGSKVAINNGG